MSIRVHFALLTLTASLVSAQEIPLSNWTAPPRAHQSFAAMTPMVDISNPVAFIAIAPCRVADTRGNGAPIQGGIFPNGGLRTWALAGICGIPSFADAISANFTVTGAPSAPPGAFLTAWPTGFPAPSVSILNFQAGQTVANAAIVPLGSGDSIQVNVSHSTHVILDVNGYFANHNAHQASFEIFVSGFQPAIGGFNSSQTYGDVAGVRGGVSGVTTNAFGVEGLVFSTSAAPGSAGVRGKNSSTSSAGVGVWGSHAGSGWGAFGESATGGYGVYGRTGGGFPAPQDAAGVRGDSASSIGVFGLTNNGYAGVSGYRVTGGGALGTGADLGYSATVGLRVSGTTQATGAKNFVEPHPTDASKVIRYSSLEGNEVGTYFRGRGRFQNGIAVIDVPEDFRIVTAPEGLSIQVTPIGEMATFAVQSIGLDRIVVRGSRNVEFFYTVNGIRNAYKDVTPFSADDKMFAPRSPGDRLPEYLPESIRARLISNGTYRPDGTVNVETARRLGWDKNWDAHPHPAPQSTP